MASEMDTSFALRVTAWWRCTTAFLQMMVMCVHCTPDVFQSFIPCIYNPLFVPFSSPTLFPFLHFFYSLLWQVLLNFTSSPLFSSYLLFSTSRFCSPAGSPMVAMCFSLHRQNVLRVDDAAPPPHTHITLGGWCLSSGWIRIGWIDAWMDEVSTPHDSSVGRAGWVHS